MAVAFRSIESKQEVRTKELDLIYIHGSVVPQPDYQPVYPEKERVSKKKEEVKEPAKKSRQLPGQQPLQSAQRSPVQSPGRPLKQSPGQSPGRSPGQSTKKSPRQSPRRPHERSPRQLREKRKLARQIKKNRLRALAITRGYATFLIVAAIMAVVVCVMYLQMNASIMHSSREVTGLRRQLTDITAANEAAYQVVRESIDLERIRVRAVEEMGMISVHEGRVIEYNRPTEVHVFVHYEIPSDGVLAISLR